MDGKPIPKTIAAGRIKRTPDGRVISINHPNPTGKARQKRPYRSLMAQRAGLLPAKYRAENPHPQNGAWNCPVEGCDSVFTRKAGLMNHIQRVNGHANDVLTDNGNGTFRKVKGDMRGSHQRPGESPAAISQSIQGDEIRPAIEDESAGKSQLQNQLQNQFQDDLNWAVGIGLQEYEAAKQQDHAGAWDNHQPWDNTRNDVVGGLKIEAEGEMEEARMALEGVDEFAHLVFEGNVGLQFQLDQAWGNDVAGEVEPAATNETQEAWPPALEDAGEHGNLAFEENAGWEFDLRQEWNNDLFS
ncbi:hypothetical protein V495_00522 [Pseudogymnoascus sp. VKM F-4514 (FW-929)]|nr:hypothetical protein V495_00522 [Pseudogymnoascus sp. VKM F-4514 (FW-929)]KFY66312.1 hypothetical protein V497_00974 [Pseudogymnoascus sp. VKM F-4516 (FW-969)]